jgi:hypothetical protein
MPTTENLTADAVKRDATKVIKINVVAHTLGAISDITSDNHWSIYLVLSNTASIRMTMRCGGAESSTGTLIWTKAPYVESNSQLRSWTYEPTQTITVKDVANLIYGNKRHIFEFSGGGSGCRFWMYVVFRVSATLLTET